MKLASVPTWTLGRGYSCAAGIQTWSCCVSLGKFITTLTLRFLTDDVGTIISSSELVQGRKEQTHGDRLPQGLAQRTCSMQAYDPCCRHCYHQLGPRVLLPGEHRGWPRATGRVERGHGLSLWTVDGRPGSRAGDLHCDILAQGVSFAQSRRCWKFPGRMVWRPTHVAT